MLVTVALLLLSLLSSSRAAAQGTDIFEPPKAQFVFVIDDSGSMSLEQYERTDPDRLAVFAVRALLGVLDERDWASVVRLNGALDGEEPPPLAPLAERHRSRLAEVLDLNGKLAAYRGGVTPCRSALEEVRELLDGAHRANVSQVVIFLTDGRCTPGGSEENVLGFLDGLRSSLGDRSRFQFYLLRFQGTELSPGLRQLAERSGGAAINVRKGDPTRILYTFAQAISRSQGFESQILTATNPNLPAHRGARRVRLLAVAAGAGRDDALEIGLTDHAGRRLPITFIEQGVHHFVPDGQPYRFVSAEYEPTGEPIRVEVLGAGSDWDAVALPEYRLGVELVLKRGHCDEAKERIKGNTLAAGSDLCAVVHLINARAQDVGHDVTAGKLEGVLEISSGRQPEPRTVVATPADMHEARFELDLQALAEGYHTLRAEVRLTPPGESVPWILKAPERTIGAVERAIVVHPAELGFGTVFPGQEATESLRLEGGFSESEVKAEIQGADRIPGCVSLELAGRPLGETVRMLRQQTYPLTLTVAAQCARDEVAPMSTQLLIRMPELPAGEALAVPITWRLDSTVRIDDRLRFDLVSGRAAQGTVGAPAGMAAGNFEARLDPPMSASGNKAKKLDLGFFAPDHHNPMKLGPDGTALAAMQVSFGPDDSIRLHVEARRCCGSGLYRSRLRLRPVDGGQIREIPIEIRVDGDWWICNRSRIIAGILGLLVALIIFYVLSMFGHSRFLDRRQLATRLVPLRWPSHGGAPRPNQDRSGDREVIEDIVDLGLRPHHRALTWLRANPLVFGLPNGRYRETLELVLVARDLEGSSVELVPERDVVGRLRAAKEMDTAEEGRLFVQAGDSVSFQAALGPTGTVRQLTVERFYGRKEGIAIEQMKKGQRLIHTIPERDRREGAVAGWALE